MTNLFFMLCWWVELRGNPNAAAKRFWKAVELMAGQAGEGVK